MTWTRTELLKMLEQPGTYKITQEELEILDPHWPERLRHVRPSAFRVHIKANRSPEFEALTRWYQVLKDNES